MRKILVIGESCQDIFVYCDALRLAPDLPVPIIEERYRNVNPGMALNVSRNIKGLGVECETVTNSNWEKISKTRFVHEITNHMFIRVDSHQRINPINLDSLDLDYDLIVIADYDKGFISKSAIENVCARHQQVFLDTKKPLGDWAKNAKYIKINYFEYQRSIPYLDSELENKLIVTLGAQGAMFRKSRFPVEKVEVRDTSGAGDTFMAALVCNYLEYGDIQKSIISANKHASESVKKRGVVSL